MPRPFSEAERTRIRASILAAGREAMAGPGLRKTSVAGLCRAAGISKGAFYLFFGGKTDIVVELLREAEAELRAELDAAVRPDEPRRVLHEVLSIVFESVHRHPLLHALADPGELAWLERCFGPEVIAEARADDDRYFFDLLERLQCVGAVRRDLDPEVFAGLAPTALAVAWGRALVGPAADKVTSTLIDALVGHLIGPGPSAT